VSIKAFNPARLRGFDFVIAALIVVGVTRFLFGLIQAEAGSELNPAHPTVLSVMAAAMLFAVFYFVYRGGVLALEPTKKTTAWVFKQYLLFLPVLGLVALLNLSILRFFDLGLFQEIVVGIATLESESLPTSLLYLIVVLPLLEEILFRGYLFGWLSSRADYGPKRAMVFSALVFALAHEPQSMLLMALFGALLGWVRWQTGSLRGVFFLHILHNSLAAVTTYGYIWMVNQA